VFRSHPASGMRNVSVSNSDARHEHPIEGSDGGGTWRGRGMMAG
jgi:hypothetical protein